MQYADMADETDAALAIKALRERAGLSVRKMAERMKMPPSTYGHYEDPRRFKGPYLPVEIAEKIAEAVEGTRVDSKEVWALTGPSSALVSAADASPALDKSNLVSVYDVTASAGHGAVVDDEERVSSLAFPPGYLRKLTRANPRDLAIITVKGDSMLPTLGDDDVVMLDMSKRDLSYDGLFILRDNGDGLLVKRVGRASRSGYVSLISDNRTLYPAVERAIEDIEVIGKVLWHGRKV